MALLCCQNIWAYFYCMYHVVIICTLSSLALGSVLLIFASWMSTAIPGMWFLPLEMFSEWMAKHLPVQTRHGLWTDGNWGQGIVFHFYKKCLHIAHKNTVFHDFFFQPLMWLSPQKPHGLERTIMALGILSSLISSLHQAWLIFIMGETTDFT